MQHYRHAFIEGTTNICALTIKDHKATNMYKQAMALEAKEAASSLMEYAPVVRAMAQTNLSKAARLKIKEKLILRTQSLKKIFAIKDGSYL